MDRKEDSVGAERLRYTSSPWRVDESGVLCVDRIYWWMNVDVRTKFNLWDFVALSDWVVRVVTITRCLSELMTFIKLNVDWLFKVEFGWSWSWPLNKKNFTTFPHFWWEPFSWSGLLLFWDHKLDHLNNWFYPYWCKCCVLALYTQYFP